MGKGRRRPSSRWWRWSSKGRGGEKFYVKVLWEKLRSNRGIQEEDLGVLVLGREQKSKKMKTNIYKELNFSKMKKWTKCPISRLPNLGVGLFEAQQVNSDSQIVFKRQNILVCAQNVNEGKK